MKKSTAIILTLAIATLSIGVPVWMAIQESERQGLELETSRALGYARDVLLRSDHTAEQVARGTRMLAVNEGSDPCSDANLALMRQIDLTSSYIQAIGHVHNNSIDCWSLGRDTRQVALTGPDFITAQGVGVYQDMLVPFIPQQTFIALEFKGYIAIIHKDLPIDTTTSARDVSLAIYSLFDTRYPLSTRGYIGANWLNRLGTSDETTFIDGRHVVAIARSNRYKTAAIAAVPLDYVDTRAGEAARRLVPAGLIAGLILAGSVLLLARTQMALPAAIKSGLKRNEFFLVYQPIVNLQTGAWVGAEALIRWRRSSDEVVDPNLFIPLAEQCGLIVQITRRVFELLARDAEGFMLRHPGFHIAVNLSAADLHSPQLGATLERVLEDTGAAPGNIVLEMTERGLLDVQVARDVIGGVRERGFQVAIDDFGTGYSSLSYLQALEVDYLKIDKSFIEAIATDAPTREVVPHIIDMAKGLKLRMVAEGVETEAQADYLRQRGVELAQGWLFGKPMPFAELAERVALESRQPAPSSATDT